MIEFKKISESFFGEQGITSTSANHLANLAKQRYEALEVSLKNIRFITKKFGIIGQSEDTFVISSAVNTNCDLNEYVAILDKIAKYKGFIAFLREAIKHRDDLQRDAIVANDPEIKEIVNPVFPSLLSIEEYVQGLPIKEREHYLSLEAKAAVYGKFIHPGGPYANARKDLFNAIENPRRIDLNGKDTIITVTYPQFSVETVDAVLDELQAIHRATEAEFNGVKHAIEEAIQAKYAADYQEYETKVAESQKLRQDLMLRAEKARKERQELIKSLKIQIPNKYRDIYEELSVRKAN